MWVPFTHTKQNNSNSNKNKTKPFLATTNQPRYLYTSNKEFFIFCFKECAVIFCRCQKKKKNLFPLVFFHSFLWKSDIHLCDTDASSQPQNPQNLLWISHATWLFRPGFFNYLWYRIMFTETLAKIMWILAAGQQSLITRWSAAMPGVPASQCSVILYNMSICGVKLWLPPPDITFSVHAS